MAELSEIIPFSKEVSNNYKIDNERIQIANYHTDKEELSCELTDDLSDQCGMKKNALIKYLKRFDLKKGESPTTEVFLPTKKEETIAINLVRIREIQTELNQCKLLDTAFG